MNEWNLDALYTSFQDKNFQEDLNTLKDLNKNYPAYRSEKTEASLHKIIETKIEIEKRVERLHFFIQLSLSAHTDNVEASRYLDQLNNITASMIGEDIKNNAYIAELDLDSYQDPFIKEHAYILKEIQHNQKYRLDEKQESIIAHMKNTGSYAWMKHKDAVVSSIKVNIDGYDYPLTKVLNMAHSPDKQTRMKAYFAELEAYKPYEETIATCLSGIKGEVLYTSKLRGYETPLEESCIKSRLKMETLNTLLSVMKKNLPDIREYLKIKADYLGYQNGLPWFELYAPVVEDDEEYSFEKGSQFVVDQFYTFSKHLGDFATHAIKNHWADVYPRENKVGGAFCENIRSLKQSRFLFNYGNHFSDVITVAHEFGHGFHGRCLGNQTILNTHYPMPIGETASNFCETIVGKGALKSATPTQKIVILENILSNAIQAICDIYSRFLFESRFFEARKQGPVSAEETKKIMLQAQIEAYGDGLDHNYLHPYMWTWKPHYYDSDYSFYNYPYAFGSLLAKGLYARYQKKPEHFPEDYETFLSVTGKMDLEDIAKTLDIDLTDESFWQSSIDIIKEDIDTFKTLLEEYKHD